MGAGVSRGALVAWLGTRVAVAVAAVAGSFTVLSTGGFVSRWDRWDVGLVDKIARWGYWGYPRHYPDRGVIAFFPGMPLVVRAVHAAAGLDYVAAGLVVSLLAGAVASVALARLGALEGGADVGRRAVLYLLLSPYAVFLAAGYTEPLFLAFALPCWLCARRGRWAAAGLLGFGAATVRITGAFLAVALVVAYVCEHRRPRRDALWLLAPFGAVGGYFGYLYAHTGDWLAWAHAQRYWGRSLTAPWTALHTTLGLAAHSFQGPAYTWAFRGEIASVAVGVSLTVALLALRRWAEAVYVGGQVVAFTTSSFYLSVGRATLLWFPLWLLLARWTLRRPSLHTVYLSIFPALMVVGVLAFTEGHWVG